MANEFLKQQLRKLLEGKTLLILPDEEFEQLVLAAVPNLHLEAEELEELGDFAKASQLRRIANELEHSPTKESPRIINLSSSVH